MNRSELERARASAPITGLSLDDLIQRRGRKETRRRLSAIAGVVAIGVLAAGSAFSMIEGNGTRTPTSGDTRPAAWTMPPGLTAPSGSYVYVHTVSYGAAEAYELQWWFSP